MAKNANGSSDTRDLNIGRGIVSVALLDTDGNRISGYRDLGEANNISLNVTAEELQHFSMRGGLKTLTKVVVLQQQVGLTMTLQEFNDQNLALAFSGETADYDNDAAVSGFAEHVAIAAGYAFLGQTYEIMDASGNRAYGIDAGTLTMATTDATPVPLVEGTDFTVDTEAGLVKLLTTSPNINLAEGITMTLAASAAAAPLLDEVRALSSDSCSTAYVAVKILTYNAADCGTLAEIDMYRVRLRSEGDIALLSDEYGEIPITGQAEENDALNATSPTMTIRSFKRAS